MSQLCWYATAEFGIWQVEHSPPVRSSSRVGRLPQQGQTSLFELVTVHTMPSVITIRSSCPTPLRVILFSMLTLSLARLHSLFHSCIHTVSLFLYSFAQACLKCHIVQLPKLIKLQHCKTFCICFFSLSLSACIQRPLHCRSAITTTGFPDLARGDQGGQASASIPGVV